MEKSVILDKHPELDFSSFELEYKPGNSTISVKNNNKTVLRMSFKEAGGVAMSVSFADVTPVDL